MKKALLMAPILALLTASPAMASSMPKADFSQPSLGLGLGNGLSLSVDIPLDRELSLGGAIGAPYFRTGNADVRLLYKLLRERFTLALLVGAQASGPRFSEFNYFQPMAGVALAYPFNAKLTGRLNVVVGFFDRGVTPSGLELGYKFNRDLEGTIGWNGRGDVLGLKFHF